MTDRVNAAVEGMEEALRYEVIDHMPANSGRKQLPASHDALLLDGKGGAHSYGRRHANVQTICAAEVVPGLVEFWVAVLSPRPVLLGP